MSAQTVVGQRFAGNGPNGLSYYYYATTGDRIVIITSVKILLN